MIGVVAGLAAGAAASVSVPAEFHAEVRSLRRARQTRHVVMGGAPDFEGDEELESDYSAADAKTDLQKLQWMLLE